MQNPDKLEPIANMAFLYDYLRTLKKNGIEPVRCCFQGSTKPGKLSNPRNSISALRGGSQKPEDGLNGSISKEVD